MSILDQAAECFGNLKFKTPPEGDPCCYVAIIPKGESYKAVINLGHTKAENPFLENAEPGKEPLFTRMVPLEMVDISGEARYMFTFLDGVVHELDQGKNIDQDYVNKAFDRFGW